MTQAPLLAVSDLRVTITANAGTARVVDGVSFSIAEGRTLALVGESGSGKSMTAMSLLALTPAGVQIETMGTAMFGGRDLLTLSEAELRQVRGRQIAVVFQDPAAALDPLMTVFKQIRESLPPGQRGDGARRRVRELLVEVGLDSIPHIERRYPHELSGGQQQRVAIASALAGNPSLLIADEPTTALDMTVQAQILELLSSLRKARRMAMLLITHDLGVVAAHADDVVVLRKGVTVEAGPTASVIAKPRDAYTQMLLDSRPRLDAVANSGGKPDQAAPLLSIEDLTVSYPGHNAFARRVTAVDGVSLSLPRGSALGIVGESGSGKSTIAKAIVGLTPIEGGSISFDGKRLVNPGSMPAAMRARLQYIFQDSYGALNPRMTVEKAIGEPFAITGMPHRQRRDAIVALLNEVGLSDTLLGRLPRELSGGQRQRVNIARALALSPEVLICDEIVSALDVSIQAQVIKLLKELQRSRSLSLLFISHDLGVIAEICDRVMVMRAGKVLEEGPVRTVFDTPTQPYTRGLLAAAEALEGVGSHPRPSAGVLAIQPAEALLTH
ncbi:MAG: transporter ATP-binding protein [Devosia sp.]|uniref:dipeptide ABC transporter ATP-binding protein n=1 Tax=Devosia sp. TaxID=1871048 RepID=UPI00262CFE61|nr:ABC transporter ATP-binding protein [Devosia sp.]MDB5529250.1 transporter ATP-binding protein [Devosia sp.]